MRCHIRPIDALFSQFDRWQALNRACGASPLLDPDFVQPLLEQFARSDDRLAILGDPDAPKVMAVLRRNSALSWQTLQPSNAPLGLWVAHPSVPSDQALEVLVRALPGPTVMVGLHQQDPWLRPRPPEGSSISTLDYITTPRITVRGTFEEYWNARGKNLRHNMKRQVNYLARQGVATRLDVLSTPADMPRAIADYAALETAGWKGAVASAVEAGDVQSRFYIEMMRRFCARGQGFVFRYFYGDQLAASDICLNSDGILFILKTAYNEQVAGTTSPAQIMRYEVFRNLWSSLRFIEFYGPLKDWHTRWTDETRTMYHVNSYRWPVVGWLHRRRAGLASQPETAGPDLDPGWTSRGGGRERTEGA